MSDDEIPLFYANFMTVAGTASDVALEFGYKTAQETRTAVRIVMTWEHAVQMPGTIQALIDGFEREVGPIRRPKEEDTP